MQDFYTITSIAVTRKLPSHINTHAHTRTYTHTCTHTHTHKLKHTHTHNTRTYTHAHVHTRTCTHTCTQKHTRTCTHTHMHTHTYTHTCAQRHQIVRALLSLSFLDHVVTTTHTSCIHDSSNFLNFTDVSSSALACLCEHNNTYRCYRLFFFSIPLSDVMFNYL